MHLPAQIAKHFRDVYYGGNWTSSSLKQHVADISWQEATTQVYGLNSIATLVYHLSYYISAVLKVLQGGPLDAKDVYSFDHPPIQSPEDWEKMLDKVWADAEQFSAEQLPADKFGEDFQDPKYGNYYRNLHGVIEHIHYHLGQIVVIKKILRQKNTLLT